MKIVLDDERSISWNKYYAGMHWSKRSELASTAKALVLAKLDPDLPMFKDPVDITITVYFKNRPQDPDNVCTKPYIDALIGRVIEEDNMKFVSSVTSRSRIDKERPRIEIEIRKS